MYIYIYKDHNPVAVVQKPAADCRTLRGKHLSSQLILKSVYHGMSCMFPKAVGLGSELVVPPQCHAESLK